jgi:hypothetical protein
MVKGRRERTQRAHEISGWRNRTHTKPIWSQDGERGQRAHEISGRRNRAHTKPIWSQNGERGHREPRAPIYEYINAPSEPETNNKRDKEREGKIS